MVKSKAPLIEEPDEEEVIEDLVIDASGGPLADIDGPAPD